MIFISLNYSEIVTNLCACEGVWALRHAKGRSCCNGHKSCFARRLWNDCDVLVVDCCLIRPILDNRTSNQHLDNPLIFNDAKFTGNGCLNSPPVAVVFLADSRVDKCHYFGYADLFLNIILNIFSNTRYLLRKIRVTGPLIITVLRQQNRLLLQQAHCF